MLSLWSPSLSPRCGSRPPWLLPPSWSDTLDRWLCSFSFWQRRLWHTCQLLSLWHWGHSFLLTADPICSSFSAEACAILHTLCWYRQHQQVCHFSSHLLLSDSRSVLSSIFPLISNSVADLAGTVLSLLLFYQATINPRTLVSSGERRCWWDCQTGSATCALCNPL